MRRDRATIGKMLGLQPSGDLGPYTCYYSRRRRLIIFPKAPPKKPPTPAQVYQRALFRSAAFLWRRLPQSDRDLWETAARRAHLNITGYNLWMFLQTTGRVDIIQTIERHSGLPLLPKSP